MSKEIIFPNGDELLNYLNNGYPICNQCDALMYSRADPNGGYDDYVCPACGYEINEGDYEYEGHDGWTSETIAHFGGEVPPAGCRACGGPYPQCKTSCKLFDD